MHYPLSITESDPPWSRVAKAIPLVNFIPIPWKTLELSLYIYQKRIQGPRINPMAAAATAEQLEKLVEIL